MGLQDRAASIVLLVGQRSVRERTLITSEHTFAGVTISKEHVITIGEAGYLHTTTKGLLTLIMAIAANVAGSKLSVFIIEMKTEEIIEWRTWSLCVIGVIVFLRMIAFGTYLRTV